MGNARCDTVFAMATTSFASILVEPPEASTASRGRLRAYVATMTRRMGLAVLALIVGCSAAHTPAAADLGLDAWLGADAGVTAQRSRRIFAQAA